MRNNLTRVIIVTATLVVAGAGLSGCVTAYDPYPAYNTYESPWYGYGWHGYWDNAWGGYGWDHHRWEAWRREHPWVNSPNHAWTGPPAHAWANAGKPFHRG
ncbi:hypothetical protein [Reyranella sp. CPCC 100927]|uniref:hypothetical protein n=1 Tax=Reyranella sp. CPCC 100927 TaxID=2599616 RepID=UPI0011B67591|nr:hypothetical protein [Reyranella sp. CPCC 100927]TWT14016.1 hypothetical protein FQU96_08960 [Reyranella sp. CPCC 100927]